MTKEELENQVRFQQEQNRKHTEKILELEEQINKILIRKDALEYSLVLMQNQVKIASREIKFLKRNKDSIALAG